MESDDDLYSPVKLSQEDVGDGYTEAIKTAVSETMCQNSSSMARKDTSVTVR